MSIACLHRVFVDDDIIDMIRPYLESTSDRVWLSKTESCMRYTFRGVPAKRVDVCLTEGVLAEGQRMIVEVMKKTGKFDGPDRQPRTTINIRRWQGCKKNYQDSENKNRPILEGSIAIHTEPGTLTVSVSLGDGEVWQEDFESLRCDLNGYDLAAPVIWHWRRYYQHLEYDTARLLADSFGAEHPEAIHMTLAEVNRLASQSLYRESRALGWRKLTVREQRKYGVDKPWVLADSLLKDGSRSGCGQYTIESASGG